MEHASDEFKNDKDVVMTAINKNPNAIKYAEKEMRGDKDIMMKVIGKDSFLLE